MWGHFSVHRWFCIAAAAKSLQSYLTLCDPVDSSPPGSPISGILQARVLEWVAISFSNAWKWKVKVKLLSHVRLFKTPWTAAYQAPLSMGFSRQEYWSGLPLPSPDSALAAAKERLRTFFIENIVDILNIKITLDEGNHLWMFIGRIDAEDEAPLLWPLYPKSQLIGKDPDAREDWRQEENGASEGEMVGWHHWLNWHEFEQASGDGEGQESLECYSPWSCRVGRDWVTERLDEELRRPSSEEPWWIPLPLSLWWKGNPEQNLWCNCSKVIVWICSWETPSPFHYPPNTHIQALGRKNLD